MDLDLPLLLEDSLAERAARVAERAIKLKDATEVGMHGFEEGWLCCRWQMEKALRFSKF